MALIFVTGGAKSGKSKFAEDLLLSLNDGKQKNVYLATSVVFDEEMQKKVELHKARRKNNWITVESYKNFSQSLEEVMNENKKNKKNNMLVDCLTNMISNIIFENEEIDWEKPEKNQLEKCDKNVKKEIQNLCKVFKNFENVVIVSNEVGMGLVPVYPLGRYFREIAGKMNQFVAEKADEAYFVVSGIPMKIK